MTTFSKMRKKNPWNVNRRGGGGEEKKEKKKEFDIIFIWKIKSIYG